MPGKQWWVFLEADQPDDSPLFEIRGTLTATTRRQAEEVAAQFAAAVNRTPFAQFELVKVTRA